MSWWKYARLVTYGFLAGTAGVALFSSDDAKTAYTHITAAVKRCGDDVMKTFTTLKENCQDINEDANEINEKRYQAKREQEIEDAKALIAAAEQES